MKRILVTENITGTAMEALQRTFRVDFEPDLWRFPEELAQAVRAADGLIVRNQTRVTPELIQRAPELQVIGRAGAGLDNIDVEAASAAGIVVVYAPEQNSISVAELTLAVMLALARKLPAADRDTKAGGWNRRDFTGVELYGKILGIVGLGRIGYRTALRAKAFGMDVIAHDAYVNPDGITVSEPRIPLMDLSELLRRSDVVVCHLPLTDATRHLFNYENFCMMQPTAFFVNNSRGAVVDETGLIRALEEKKIAGAALDVRQKEPPVQDALCRRDNVILTPHIGAFTREGQQRVVTSVCRDVAAVLEGHAAKNYANFSRFSRGTRFQQQL